MKHQRGLTALVLFVWLSITGFGSRYSTSPDPSSLGGEGVLFALSRKKEPKIRSRGAGCCFRFVPTPIWGHISPLRFASVEMTGGMVTKNEKSADQFAWSALLSLRKLTLAYAALRRRSMAATPRPSAIMVPGSGTAVIESSTGVVS